MRNNNFYIITGGPGVGKTTVIDELQHVGFLTIREEARRIIKEQLSVGGDGVPWKDKALYARLMLDASATTFEEIINTECSEPVFFDRGLLDVVCYMDMESIPMSNAVTEITGRCVYNKNVFILPPWQEIYKTDNERKQSWEEAVYTFAKMKETYSKYGYNVIELPRASVSEKRQFITRLVV